MNRLITGLLGAAALLTFAAPASAAEIVGQIGPWNIGVDEETEMCVMYLDAGDQDIGIGYQYRSGQTIIRYTRDDLKDVSGKKFSFKLTIDDKSAPAIAVGSGQGVNITYTNRDFLKQLHDGKHFDFSEGGETIVGIASDADFDRSVEAIYNCSKNLYTKHIEKTW